MILLGRIKSLVLLRTLEQYKPLLYNRGSTQYALSHLDDP